MPDPATGSTSVPHEIVTIIRYVSPLKAVKDSELLFLLQVPDGWNVSTWRMTNSDTSDYRTDLVADNMFFISSYPSTRSREQEYRDQFRQWSPAPAETAVTINDIRFDRFESSADGNTTVAYLTDSNSANDRGYASVLIFTARDCNRFEIEDFEKVVSSFRYFSTGSAGTSPGVEIPHYDLSGNAVSRKETVQDARMFDSSDWDGGGSASDGVTSGQDSSGEPSSGGSSSGGGCSNR